MVSISALYVHLPFCHTICPFCPFPVHGNREGLHGGYLAALLEEAARYAERYSGAAQDIAAVYFGGGTPSTLAVEAVGELVARLRGLYGIAPDAEIAFEINPEDAGEAYLAGLAAAGINRVSLGLQSLDEPTLRALGRNHSARQGEAALEALRGGGIANFNVDLLHGAPEIPEGAFRADLERIVAIRPPHVSLYGLDVEAGTPFGRDAGVRAWAQANEPRQARQFLWAAELLASAGYRHYEVSNFCLPGHEGRQNLIVWGGGNYLGFGTGAHSFVGDTRWWNERHLRAYGRRLAGGELPVADTERLTRAMQANERLMLALRSDGGLDVAAWVAAFGLRWEPEQERVARRLGAEGKARWDGTTLTLTPRGLLVADAVTAELMVG